MDGMIGAWIVPASMFGLMFAMGLTLTGDDFRRIVRLPLPTLVGTLLQLVAMPLAGLGLARAFALEPMLATGLVIVAACPGGVMTNVLCHLGKADVALSITLTATATMVSLFTIPLWVSAGMLARHARPSVAMHEPWMTRASTIVMIVALGIEAVRREDPPVAAFAASWRPALLLLTAALAMGLGVPLLAQLGWRAAATIAVEICIKNTVLGLFVATQSLHSLEAAVPIVTFMGLPGAGRHRGPGALRALAEAAAGGGSRRDAPCGARRPLNSGSWLDGRVARRVASGRRVAVPPRLLASCRSGNCSRSPCSPPSLRSARRVPWSPARS